MNIKNTVISLSRKTCRWISTGMGLFCPHAGHSGTLDWHFLMPEILPVKIIGSYESTTIHRFFVPDYRDVLLCAGMGGDLAFIDKLRKRLPGSKNYLHGSLEAPAHHRNPERIVFVLDQSGSMGDSDYPPTRLRAGIAATGEFLTAKIESGTNDIVGLVVFCERAKVLCTETPLSKVHKNILKPLSKIEPDDGTDIEQGLIAAGKLIPEREDGYVKRIVLLTDGHGGRPERTAEKLKNRGIVIDVIGIGGVPSAVNERSLRKVASVVNGECRYRFIGDRAALLAHFKKIATDLVKIR